MISFLRKNAAYVGWSIVIFFCATLFSTSLFFGGDKSQKNSVSAQDIQNALVLVDGVPLDARQFQFYYNQLLSQVDYSKTGGRISPEVTEMIMYNASMKAIQDMELFAQAEMKEITVSKGEIKQAVNSLVIQYGMKNKAELKKKIKSGGTTFSGFKENIKKNLMIQKYTKQLQDEVIVTDQDVDNQYSKAKVRHILMKMDHLEESDRDVLVQQLYGLLDTKKISFDDAVLKYSEDAQTRNNGGRLGWIHYGQTIREFEEVVFDLPIKKVSRPVKTIHGYHIIQVLDRQELSKPKDIDYEKERKQLLNQRKNMVVASILQSVIVKDRITFQWPLLKAYHAKQRGDTATAEAAYQLLVSKQTFSAVPHYLLSQLYMMSNQPKKAIKEIEKAQVKVDIDATQAFPELYILAATVYHENNNKKERDRYYDRAFELAENTHIVALNELKRQLNQQNKNKDKKRLKKVNVAIKALEKQQRQATEEQKKALEEQLAKEAGIITEDEGVAE
jgi:parvulin-like peptidyl-prolyl isomerase